MSSDQIYSLGLFTGYSELRLLTVNQLACMSPSLTASVLIRNDNTSCRCRRATTVMGALERHAVTQ